MFSKILEYRSHDIEYEIDIIEKIGRIFGFNNFISRISITYHLGKISKEEHLINSFQKSLINQKLSEFEIGRVFNKKNTEVKC